MLYECFMFVLLFFFRWNLLLRSMLAMGSQAHANVCSSIAGIRFAQHTENIRKTAVASICNIRVWHLNHDIVHRRNDCQNAHSWYMAGKYSWILTLLKWITAKLNNKCWCWNISENVTRRRAIFPWPLVSIRCVYGDIPLVFYNAASLSTDGDRIEILLVIDIAFAAPIDHDSIFTCIFKVFYAKKSN